MLRTEATAATAAKNVEMTLADRIGVSRNQLSRALSGTTPIRLQEANAIRRLFPGMSLEVLFDLNEA